MTGQMVMPVTERRETGPGLGRWVWSDHTHMEAGVACGQQRV